MGGGRDGKVGMQSQEGGGGKGREKEGWRIRG